MSAVVPPTAALQDGQCAAIYQRLRPEQTVTYRIVQHHLESWLARRREADPDGEPIPSYVSRDLQNGLKCGILAHEELGSSLTIRYNEKMVSPDIKTSLFALGGPYFRVVGSGRGLWTFYKEVVKLL